MTTTDLEPAAYLYGAEREEPFASFKRWPAGVVSMQCWTETALYTAYQLQALIEERDRLREVAVDIAASLAAAISLLERGGKAAKKAAPSDKMFDQMVLDYKASLDRARAALAGGQ